MVAAVLGGAVGVFHFAIEPRLEPRIASADAPDAVDALARRLRVIPRIGLVMLTTVALLMIASARAWWL